MAGLYLIRDDDPGFAEAGLATARAQYARHGFGAGHEAALPGWRLLHFGYIVGGPELLLADGDDLVAVAGTLSVDGRMGREALAALLAMPLPALDWSRIGGQFAALVRRNGRNFVFTDHFAAFQLFHDAGRRLFSTSFLAAAQTLPRVSFATQGVYEFAFNVVAVGDDTVLAELKTLGPRHVVELTPGGTVRHDAAKRLVPSAPAGTIPERIAAHRARLDAIIAPHAAAFGDHIHCPLSGGLDSRLLLAGLRAAGSAPGVYVYGAPGSPDVEIARAIGAVQGFAVDAIDKRRAALDPAAFPALVERSFHEDDGLPNYGNIFDNGGNAAARDARHAGGWLAASGGGGEIYRDFFYLPDRPLTAAAVARTFFARFAGGDATARFVPAEFLANIRDKILAALDLPAGSDQPIPRGRIEEIYPRVRCRALFGREISIEARYGAYFMPFLDHQVVAEAMALPLRLKQAGRFEAMLLAAIDPDLARQPSAYGHDFAGPPSRRHRFAEWSTRIRPTWLRQHSYAIRRRLRPEGDEHGGLLGPEYLGRVLDLDFPVMRGWFDMAQVADSGLYRRIANLEYFAARLGSRLVG